MQLKTFPNPNISTHLVFCIQYPLWTTLSDQLSLYHSHSDLSYNALQLDQLTSSYQSDLSLQSSHLSLSSSSDSPSPPKSCHKLPSVPFLPEARMTSPLHTTSHHLRTSHPSYSAYRITTSLWHICVVSCMDIISIPKSLYQEMSHRRSQHPP